MNRPMGGVTGATVRRSSSSMAVAVAAGAMTLAVTPRGASSIAQDRISAVTAALHAAYWLRPAAPALVRLPMASTRPPEVILGTIPLASRVRARTWTAHIA